MLGVLRFVSEHASRGIARWILGAAFLNMVHLSPLQAQDATVFYVHGFKGDTVPELYYRLAGQDTARRASGVPNPLRVPEGGRVCFRVDGGNPLLYTYAVGSKVLKTDTPDTVSSIIKAMLALSAVGSTPIKVAGAGFLQGGDNVDAYSRQVSDVARQSTLLSELREASDGAHDLRSLLDSGAVLVRKARAASDSADVLYKGISDDAKVSPSLRMIRATQVTELNRANTLAKQFESARQTLRHSYCETVGAQPLRITLIVTPGGDDVPADKHLRVTGNSVASVTVQPVATRAFDFGAGVVLAVPFRPYTTYSLKGTLIHAEAGDQLLIRPLVLVNLRGWSSDKVWLTLGTAGSASALTDGYLGLTYRAGNLGGITASLSGGLSIVRLPTKLEKGVPETDLPTDVSFDDAVHKSWVPAFGVGLTLSAP